LLLGTIRVPKNLRLLSDRLPKSNYEKKDKKRKEGKSVDDLPFSDNEELKSLAPIKEECENKVEVKASIHRAISERPANSLARKNPKQKEIKAPQS